MPLVKRARRVSFAKGHSLADAEKSIVASTTNWNKAVEIGPHPWGAPGPPPYDFAP